VVDHVSLMPDAHFGIGATVGAVIPTKGAILPAAVGVDLGCGMIAVELRLQATQLPDDLHATLGDIARAVPAGVGQGHDETSRAASAWFDAHQPATDLSHDLRVKALNQFGTLGGGNHFVEICLDERDVVWVVLHSGSRGIGNILANDHIKRAKHLAKHLDERIESPDLARFVEGTKEFTHYITDMLWAQDYALANRELMMTRVLSALKKTLGTFAQGTRIQCHHNFAAKEVHMGQEMWITRKGAIKAGVGDLGIIPGSMGTRSYIVEGLGNAQSWNSCSHGAGRLYGRKAAEARFDADDLRTQMKGVTWLEDRATHLVDEIPSAYKDIDQVMRDQPDLVHIRHTLHQVLNFKGV
jgi:RNA-splicing ligase RtcB